MSSNTTRMTQSDMFSWRMEHNPVLRSTVVVVLLLDVSPDWDRLVATAERAAQVLPAMRRKLVPDVGLAPPRWIEDPDFDLRWHLRRLAAPHPKDLRGVLEVARTKAMTAFDPARPMWEYTLLDGLERDGAAAVVMKFHHSMTDGVGAVRIAAEIMDFERSGTPREPAPDSVARAADPSILDTVGWYASSATVVVRASVVGAARLGTRMLFQPIRAVRDVGVTLASIARVVEPVLRTQSPVMTERSTRRHLATLNVPVDGLAAAAEKGGGTLNDAFLAGIVLGMREYHRRHDSDVDRLRITMPVNLRPDDDETIGGNQITLLRFVIPSDIPEPAKLIGRIHEIVANWRLEPAVPLAQPIAGALNVLPSSAVGAMLEHVDFLASDVPGSPVSLYMAGAKIIKQYAFGPTIGAAFNVTLLSYVGECCLGIDVDDAAVPDLDVLVDSLGVGFDEVCTP
ncbi:MULTISPECIES: wax ester/triacylglycerol synthase domain-containing protein [Gordonia]|uniref:wax ester/triacylglycerol synthase domain-containing protein n=1 Tax=Gordonia TaxID=2053 RepID=UPI0032B538EE